jgi:SAM-dependent methyltransferase
VPPSAFFVAQMANLSAAARQGPVVDLACGRGRHCLAVAEGGAQAIGLDHNPAFLSELAERAAERDLPVECVLCDLESSTEIPLKTDSCAAILVFRFLYRPLAPKIADALQPGGLLLYETFTTAQRDLPGGPRNPAFLLEPGELPKLFPTLDVLAYWEGQTGGNAPAALARLAARKPAVRPTPPAPRRAEPAPNVRARR